MQIMINTFKTIFATLLITASSISNSISAQDMLYVRHGHKGTLDSHNINDGTRLLGEDFIRFSDDRISIGKEKSYVFGDIDSIMFDQPAISVPEASNRVALLDMTVINNESETTSDFSRSVYSAKYMMDITGLPYFITQNLDSALQFSKMILLSSGVKERSFTKNDYVKLTNWVAEGGIIISPAVTSASALNRGGRTLFGINETNYSKLRHRMYWTALPDKECAYIDTPEEQVVSLARGKDEPSASEGIRTYGYKITEGAESIAMFNDTAVAVVRNRIGKGTAYSFALMWRDVIQRNQLNKDFDAQRIYSNAFEPTADVFPLFIRATYAATQPFSVWKNTVPDGYKSVLIPTHDCDSRTAYDEMHWMSEYEKSIGLSSQFFITVHYFRDKGYLSAFYDDAAIENCKKLLADGHTIGSHSICHFPDFNVTDRFPMTVTTKEEYALVANHDTLTDITIGGSTWAEVVLSKKIIDEDLGLNIRSFRTGHLCMNKNIPQANQEAGYAFQSCYSAGDVLSEFAFPERIGNDWGGDFSGTLTMPLHISDVISDDPIDETNWMEKPARWLGVQQKLQGNYAPCILLIHPNRDWKMKVEKQFIEMLDLNEVGLYNFEDYGDFWTSRQQFDFDFALDEYSGTLVVKASSDAIKANPHLTLILEQGTGQLPGNAVMVLEDGTQKPLTIRSFENGRFSLTI